MTTRIIRVIALKEVTGRLKSIIDRFDIIESWKVLDIESINIIYAILNLFPAACRAGIFIFARQIPRFAGCFTKNGTAEANQKDHWRVWLHITLRFNEPKFN